MHADAKWLKLGAIKQINLLVASRRIEGQSNLQMIHIVWQKTLPTRICEHGEKDQFPLVTHNRLLYK